MKFIKILVVAVVTILKTGRLRNIPSHEASDVLATDSNTLDGSIKYTRALSEPKIEPLA